MFHFEVVLFCGPFGPVNELKTKKKEEENPQRRCWLLAMEKKRKPSAGSDTELSKAPLDGVGVGFPAAAADALN